MMYVDYHFHIDGSEGNVIRFDKEFNCKNDNLTIEDGALYKAEVSEDGKLVFKKTDKIVEFIASK